MFKHLFSAMNDVLDHIIHNFPSADGTKRNELAEQLQMLKKMSDECVEEWLLFEEKMTQFESQKAHLKSNAVIQSWTLSDVDADTFFRGQGYFQLYMYDQAIKEFQKVIQKRPDFTLARYYLALGLLGMEKWSEAGRHFQSIIPQTSSPQMKAVSLNALGCIHVKNNNMEKAFAYFQLAYHTDPTFPDPIVNMGVCLNNEGTLHYGMGPGIGTAHL